MMHGQKNIKLQITSCRVYLHLATDVCSCAYPSSTARSLFYANNTLITMTFISFLLVALYLYIIWGLWADSREVVGWGLTSALSTWTHVFTERSGLWRWTPWRKDLQKPTVVPLLRNKFPLFSKPTHHYCVHSKLPLVLTHTLAPQTTLPSGIFGSSFDTKISYAMHFPFRPCSVSYVARCLDSMICSEYIKSFAIWYNK